MFTIYKIIYLDNNRTYIGMTGDDLKNRYSKHVRQMRSNTHYNAEMQADCRAKSLQLRKGYSC
jgi:predicted GIY-YIG superfamily endonuclease